MDSNKALLITIDTEGDNQWNLAQGISTENSLYIPRFQELCERYGFVPTWLTNYEMAMDTRFAGYIKPKIQSSKCEVGAHLHAWNNPPEYQLASVSEGRPYLIEYPLEVMDDKLQYLLHVLQNQFECSITSHRSGRWALDRRYISLLEKYGIAVDCSVTPHIDWCNSVGATGCGGSDYSSSPENPFLISESVIELPMSIRRVKRASWPSAISVRSILSSCKGLLVGRDKWLRPKPESEAKELVGLLDKLNVDSSTGYAMFMIHSSELMPGGSPSFPDEASVDKMYGVVEALFSAAVDRGFYGCGISDFAESLNKASLPKLYL